MLPKIDLDKKPINRRGRACLCPFLLIQNHGQKWAEASSAPTVFVWVIARVTLPLHSALNYRVYVELQKLKYNRLASDY